MRTHSSPAIGLAMALVLATGGAAMATEQPKHEVVAKFKEFEVRRYVPTIVAETVVTGERGDASNEGFRRLAGYIFGGNQGKRSIAMTAPVAQQEGAKIDMTAPVAQHVGPTAGSWTVQFTMPAEWTLEALPKPNDPRVMLKAVPSRRVAVLRYSGTWSESNLSEHVALLQTALTREGLRAVGATSWARYDPPWTPWFLRTNEVQVEVE